MKKGETPVVALGELLNMNSASGRSSAQLSVVTIDSEVLFESLVRPLGLTISFWVITRGEVQGHSECFSERAEEVGDELRTSVGGDMGGYSVFGKHMRDEELGKLRGSDGVIGRNEYSLL